MVEKPTIATARRLQMIYFMSRYAWHMATDNTVRLAIPAAGCSPRKHVSQASRKECMGDKPCRTTPLVVKSARSAIPSDSFKFPQFFPRELSHVGYAL